MNRIYLGIIKKEGKIINHRSLLKCVFNPFLRVFGITIATIFDVENQKLGLPYIMFHKPSINLLHNLRNTWCYPFDPSVNELVKSRAFI